MRERDGEIMDGSRSPDQRGRLEGGLGGSDESDFGCESLSLALVTISVAGLAGRDTYHHMVERVRWTMDRRRKEWRVLKGLCRGLRDPLWYPLWEDAVALHPDCFTQIDLRKVYEILDTIHQQHLDVANDLSGMLSKSLAAVYLGGFNVESLLTSSPRDSSLSELKELISGLGQKTHPRRNRVC